MILGGVDSYSSAFLFGIIPGAGLIIGSLVGAFAKLSHKQISSTMSLGAGMLIAASAVELAAEVFEKNPFLGTCARR